MIAITQLYIYPIKSCRGIALERALITTRGFDHDREWMIVRADGRFVTQREQPSLALLETAIDAVALTVRAPGMEALSLPLTHTGAAVEVKCWSDVCAAYDAGDGVAEWLSTYLGAPHRLVRFDPEHRRPSNLERTGGHEALNRFSDAYPWLLISEASLVDLNGRLEQPLAMNRFRPNIVISGVEPYAEDRIEALRARDAVFTAAKNCTRCVITTTDQATGTRDGEEPLRTLRRYRFDRALRGVIFGQNVVALAGVGTAIAVGDECTLELRD